MTYNHPDILKNTPYFDDFDDTKRFLRILFKPGYSVQARELTQLQTLLQNQISKFGDHIFRDGSLVFGGLTSLNRVKYLRVTANYIVNNFKSIENQTILNLENNGTTVRAKVLFALPSENNDNSAILFLQYLTGKEFSQGEKIYVGDLSTSLTSFWGGNASDEVVVLNTTTTSTFSGDAILASVDEGIFYIDGFFVKNEKQSIPLYQFNSSGIRTFNSPSNKIGFVIQRNIISANSDTTLKDPANGSYNFNAPGADRYRIDLVLNSQTFIGDESAFSPSDLSTKDFIELARVVSGKLTFVKKIPTYSDILEIFARRTYDESGNYTVRPFTINIKENVRRDKIRFVAQLTSGSVANRSTTNLAFSLPTTPQSTISYEIGSSESDRLPINIGDILISESGVQYKVSNIRTINVPNGNADIEVVPFDSDVLSTSNPYKTGSKLIQLDERFILRRLGSNVTVSNNHYRSTSNVPSIITDITGYSSLLENGSSDKFSIEISDGKAYIFGYEYETTNPITINGTKPRQFNTVLNEIIDTSLGNYLKVVTTNSYFNDIDKKYDTTFDMNDFPDIFLTKQFVTLLLPNSSQSYSKFKVKYFSKSERNSVNKYQTYYTYYNWELPKLSSTVETPIYPDVVFIQSMTTDANVLRDELGPDSSETDVDDNGFILRRVIGNSDTVKDYNVLLGVKREGGNYIPAYTDELSKPEILDSSYETETNISRLVFTELWHGDFKTAYDSSLERGNYDPGTDKLTRTYVDDESNYVYQLDYINLADVPVDEEGNVSLTDLSTRLRVKRANTRAWVPGSTRETGSITASSLYIKVPSSNVVFGPDVGISRGFCLPNSNADVQESGVVFNPTDGKEISYGSSIVASSQEYNVVEITLLTPPGQIRCEQTLNDVTTRGFGSYTEGSTVIQTYIRYSGTSETDKVGTTVTVQGTVIKVVPVSGGNHKIFVKLSGSTGDFVPQNFESLKIPGTQVNQYEGISALLMSDNIFTSPICACHTIKGVDLLDDETGTCGIFTTVIFSDGSGFGDYIVGEQVYQYDIDYVPLNNTAAPTNFDGTKILAQGTVVDWDGTRLTLIATKNEFKAKSGWIFGKTSKVRYGGRGWSTNYHKTTNVSYTGSTSVFEIEKVKGVLVYIKPNTTAFYNDEFNSSDPNIPNWSYQVKSFSRENSLNPTGVASPWWTPARIASEKPSIRQIYVENGVTITASGRMIYFKEGGPTTGPTIMTIEADPTKKTDFKFKLRTTYPITIIGTHPSHQLAFSILNAQKVKPQVSIYSDLETEAAIPGEVVSSTVVAKAKAKQLKYIPKAGLATKEQYYLYLTDIIPYSVEGTLFKVDNLYSVITETGSNDITLFTVEDSLGDSVSEEQFNVQEPKNNSLLYNYPVGERIKEVTDLTYELQVDLSTTLNTTTSTLTFTTDVLGTTEFKGSYTVNSVTLIDKSILSEYILVDSNSRVYDLTNPNIIQSIEVDEGTNKTVTITFSQSASDIGEGVYRLICPIVIKGSLSSNIRKKTKRRNIEVNRFDPVTGTMTLKKSDVISIDSCINLGTSLELPTQAIKLNNNQTLNLYKLSTITGNEKWRDLQIRNSSQQVTTQPNGIWCLVSYTYYDHGTEYGPIIPASYEDGYDTIPTFTDPVTNRKINLDSVIDFRPFERINSAGQVVTSGIYGVPISGSRMNVSYSYYLPQNYKLVLSRDKNFYLLSGEASTEPHYPNDLPNAMSLFKIQLPAYLTNSNDSKVVSLNHQRYTMDDIRTLEERIDNIEYVTRLSYLEQNAKNISIRSSDSTERPKTSILVDSFINHEIADTINPDYNSCIDSSNNTLRPTFKLNQLELDFNENASSGDYFFTKQSQPLINVGQTLPPNILTLKHTTTPIVKQLLATGFTEINAFSNTVWVGTMTASVYTDSSFDVTSKPYILSNYNGENDTFENMQFSPINDNLGAFGTKWNFWQTNWQGYIDNDKPIRTMLGRVEDQVNALTPKTPKRKINKKVINADVVPLMPSRSITIYARGMKPSTILYPYFGGVRVDSYITKTTGTDIKTDAFGNVTIVFNIPSGVFQSGEKNFVLMDNENNDRSLCTTYAEFKYSNTSSRELNNYLNTFGASTVNSQTNDFNDYQTVLAQTFFVDPVQYPRGVYVKSIDVYFRSVDSFLPITLEMRSVANGVPSLGPGTSAYPNSTVTLRPSSLSVITNGAITSQNGSSFQFNAPVHLLPGEHALVFKTNSNNYLVYTSEVGETVLNTQNRASVQPFVGKMMKSNNSQSWTIFENTDIAFTVHRCVFNNTAKAVFSDQVKPQNEIRYSLMNLNVSYSDLNTNSLLVNIKTLNRSSVSDSVFDTIEMPISPNTNIEFDTIKYFKFNGQSFSVSMDMKSDGVIAPMIDLDTLRLYAVSNVIRTMNNSRFDKGSTTLTKEENETYPYSTVHEDFINARYITKVVTLDPDMQTTDCYVYFKLNKPKGTDVKVYIKRQFTNNNIGMDETEYEELTLKTNISYSSDPNKYTEVMYKIPDERAVNEFVRYSIKIVMFSDVNDGAFVPKVKDLRIITVA